MLKYIKSTAVQGENVDGLILHKQVCKWIHRLGKIFYIIPPSSCCKYVLKYSLIGDTKLCAFPNLLWIHVLISKHLNMEEAQPNNDYISSTGDFKKQNLEDNMFLNCICLPL